MNGGGCEDEVNGYTCNCDDTGYEGTNCETDVNECRRDDEFCVTSQANCTNEQGSFRCECLDGFTGDRCETNIDECASQPCNNNATYHDAINGFTCHCMVGYTGSQCETDINECASDPCLNGGTCSDEVGLFTCTCPSNFTGVTCNDDVNECDTFTGCVNGAVCFNTVGSFYCECPSGLTGILCDVDIDECVELVAPCNQNGVCINTVGSFLCVCDEGYDRSSNCAQLQDNNRNQDGGSALSLPSILFLVVIVVFAAFVMFVLIRIYQLKVIKSVFCCKQTSSRSSGSNIYETTQRNDFQLESGSSSSRASTLEATPTYEELQVAEKTYESF